MAESEKEMFVQVGLQASYMSLCAWRPNQRV